MTRDEHRAKCIEAIRAAFEAANDDQQRFPLLDDCWAAAFDALPSAGARVDPVEATEEMMKAARDARPSTIWYMWLAMSAAGDLTNPPEGKP